MPNSIGKHAWSGKGSSRGQCVGSSGLRFRDGIGGIGGSFTQAHSHAHPFVSWWRGTIALNGCMQAGHWSGYGSLHESQCRWDEDTTPWQNSIGRSRQVSSYEVPHSGATHPYIGSSSIGRSSSIDIGPLSIHWIFPGRQSEGQCGGNFSCIKQFKHATNGGHGISFSIGLDVGPRRSALSPLRYATIFFQQNSQWQA